MYQTEQKPQYKVGVYICFTCYFFKVLLRSKKLKNFVHPDIGQNQNKSNFN